MKVGMDISSVTSIRPKCSFHVKTYENIMANKLSYFTHALHLNFNEPVVFPLAATRDTVFVHCSRNSKIISLLPNYSIQHINTLCVNQFTCVVLFLISNNKYMWKILAYKTTNKIIHYLCIYSMRWGGVWLNNNNNLNKSICFLLHTLKKIHFTLTEE